MIPDLSVLWVVFFVLLLVAILNSLLFKPVRGVVAKREDAIRSAQDLARSAAARAESATAELGSKLHAARAEVYREMDEKRRTALEHRSAVLAETRREAEVAIQAAGDQLRTQASVARARLSDEADHLGATIAQRILGRPS